MRTSVRNIMMGLMLTGGLLLATPMSAQMRTGRRPSGNDATMSNSRRSEARSNETRSAQSMTGSRSRSDMGTATRQTQVATQKDNRGNDRRSNVGDRNNGGSNYGNERRPNGGDRNNGGSNYGNERRPNGGDRNNGGSNSGNERRPNGGDRNNGGGNNGGYNHNDNRGGNHNDNRGHDNRGGYNHNDNRGHDNRGGYNHNDNRGHDNRGGYNHRPENRGHNAYRDHYSWNYSHNNWSRPLPPPARMHRPAPYIYHRPRIPVGYRPYYGAPVIDRILGITFGTMFNVSLNYLYTNGYTIDGYDNRTVYLRNVHMLNFYWDDVMLCYDDYSRLMNAQFIFSASYNDRSRYNRLYHDLCGTYGSPIEIDGRGVTWFGGNSVGYVTLETSYLNGRYYTNVFIGN